MQCREVLARISAYTDGELSFQERREIEIHLTQCKDCAHVAEGVAGLQVVVANSLCESVASPDLVDSIMADIPVANTQRRFSWRWAWAAVPAAAAAALLYTNAALEPALEQQAQRHAEPKRIAQKLSPPVSPIDESRKKEAKQQESVPVVDQKDAAKSVIRNPHHRHLNSRKPILAQRDNRKTVPDRPVPVENNSQDTQAPGRTDLAQETPAVEGPVIVLRMADVSVVYSSRRVENPPPPPREQIVERPPIMPEVKGKFNTM